MSHSKSQHVTVTGHITEPLSEKVVVRPGPTLNAETAVSSPGPLDKATPTPHVADRATGQLTAEVSTAALVHNCRVLRGLMSSGCQRLCVAVKCNAYGHGLAVTLRALQQAQVEMVCVAHIAEAQQVRALGWQAGVLLLGSELSIYGAREQAALAGWLVAQDVRVTPTCLRDVAVLADAARATGKRALVHLMLDTGMTRMGVSEKELWALLDAAEARGPVEVEGLYTHLATADEADKDFARQQLERFGAFAEALRRRGRTISLLHAGNSGGLIDLPESRFDMARPGISVYGYHASGQMHHRPDLRPALRVVSRLTLVKRVEPGSFIGYGCTYQAKRQMVIGIVPIGYGDGYDRRLSNGAVMTVRGQRAPVVGRVSMDQTIIDLTDVDEGRAAPAAGEAVVVIDDVAEAPNSVESLAAALGTIPYEVVTRLGARIERVGV